jgi:hypothetical protein
MTSEKNEEPEKIQHVPDDVGVVIPPDGGYAWVVLIAAFVMDFSLIYKHNKQTIRTV